MKPKITPPQVEIERTQFDLQVEIIAIAGLIILLLLPAFYYNQLPDTIPIHYGTKGLPDGYGNKGFIWLLPLLGIMLYILMTFAGSSTKYLNYPGKLTEENRVRVYTNMLRMVRVLKACILALFIFIVWRTIQIALGNETGLGPSFLPVFLLLIFGPMVYFQLKATRKI